MNKYYTIYDHQDSMVFWDGKIWDLDTVKMLAERSNHVIRIQDEQGNTLWDRQ